MRIGDCTWMATGQGLRCNGRGIDRNNDESADIAGGFHPENWRTSGIRRYLLLRWRFDQAIICACGGWRLALSSKSSTNRWIVSAGMALPKR